MTIEEGGALPSDTVISAAVIDDAAVDDTDAGDAGAVASPRRRPRTALILAGAAVLGVLAGGGVGYRIQQQRTPTPLPPLTGPVLEQPKGVGPAAPVLPAAQDRQAVYDGDLLALMLPAPKGSTDAHREWQTLGEYADRFDNQQDAFRTFASNDFRRSVNGWWTTGGSTFVSVDLVQYRDNAAAFAPEQVTEEFSSNEYNPQYGDSVQIDGTMDGHVWGSAEPERKSGYEPVYHGRGVARVGSIQIDVFVDALTPVRASTVMSVITKQLERL